MPTTMVIKITNDYTWRKLGKVICISMTRHGLNEIHVSISSFKRGKICFIYGNHDAMTQITKMQLKSFSFFNISLFNEYLESLTINEIIFDQYHCGYPVLQNNINRWNTNLVVWGETLRSFEEIFLSFLEKKIWK